MLSSSRGVSSCSAVPSSLQTPGLKSARLLCPREFSGKNPGAGCHFLLQRLIPAQGWNPCLLPLLQEDSLSLSHRGHPHDHTGVSYSTDLCKSVLLPVFQIKFHWNTGFPGGSDIKNLPAIQETRVPSLGREDPLEKDVVTHSGILAWRIPWAEECGRPQSMRVTRSWTRLKRPSTHTCMAVFALWMQRWLVAAQTVWPQT